MLNIDSYIIKNIPFVIYKRPGSPYVNIVEQQDSKLYKEKHFNVSGFYFHPFTVNNKTPVVVFPDRFSIKKKILLRTLALKKQKPSSYNNTFNEYENIHKNKVERAIKEITFNKELKKVIISSKLSLSLKYLNPEYIILQLMNAYEDSFVWLWHHPAIGIWAGATPELLLSYKKNILKTMALAGTLPVSNRKPVIWGMKEVKEQQIVTDYIKKKLNKFSSNVNVFPPKTVFQGNISHIRTDIEAEMDIETAKKVIVELHPTPAVCGLPIIKSKELIEEIEQYDREYYTGFFGIIEDKEIELFVNLRSLRIKDNDIDLFVGGGIIKESNPEKEWEEILYKSKILLNSII